MKVLHIISTLNNGGAEKMLVDILGEMKKNAIHVEILVLSRKGDFYSKEIKKMGIHLHFGETDKIYHLSHLHTVQTHMKKNFDIIHAHLFAPQLYVAFAKKNHDYRNTQYITTEHSTHNRRREFKILKLLDYWMYKQYDQIIAITKGTMEGLNGYLSSTRNKTVVVENGIKLEQYKNAIPLNRTQLIPNNYEGDVLVLMVAAMREGKDHETVIRASKLLPNNYHIVFVGDGVRMEEVQKYAKENGSPRIHFLERRTDVPSIMKTCDVFVLSSHWEGFGLVAVEAMASGIPVIASDVEGLNNIVGNAGILFSVCDESELSTNIIKTVESKSLNNDLVNKGIQRSNMFKIQKTVDKYIEIYKKVLSNEKNK